MTISDCVSELLKSGIRCDVIKGETEVLGTCCNSLSCEKGDLFFCKGANFKKEYLYQAVLKGASGVVISRELGKTLRLPKDIGTIIADNARDLLKAMAICSMLIYGRPMDKMHTVAVTGTKGKSSVCDAVVRCLRSDGHKAALLSDYLTSDAQRLTTPEATELHRAARSACKDGVEYLVCEVSSQAQKLYRTYGIEFETAVFTNLGHDHIGPLEHRDMEEYFLCKASLFRHASRSVINVFGEYGKRLYGILDQNERIGFSKRRGEGDFYCGKVNIGAYGCDLRVFEKAKKSSFRLVCPSGAHNVENALCVAAVCRSLGISEGAVMSGIASAGVSGRGEVYKSADGNKAIVVDYAHNEMSFEAVLSGVQRQFGNVFVTVVFGCPGNKGECRRRDLAEVCSKYADRVIICEDDSADEGYEAIAKQMKGYFKEILNKSSRLDSFRISYVKDRAKALDLAIELTESDGKKEVIFLLGKGNEGKNRDCGFDRLCEKDASIAKKAMVGYDLKHTVKDKLDKFGAKRYASTLVVISQDQVGKILSDLQELISSGARIVLAVRNAYEVDIENEAFKYGLSVTVRSFDSLANTRSLVGEMNVGVLPVFTFTGAADTLIGALTGELFIKKVVYVDKSPSIISGDAIGFRRIGLKALTEFAEGVSVKYLNEIEAAINGGALEFVSLDEGSVIGYFCDGRCLGTAVTGK